MSSCTFEELVAQVAEMLRRDAPQEQIDRVLQIFSQEYRAEVIAAARELVGPAHP